ncbi:hypothetical protein ACH5RR_035863 [Cinchona calisaya]|uniref:Uncharacterized protein n=1 Tax=Cinchona calisaya TaxID=153742 RepID=A0ABD2Y520_9GENT
MVDVLKLRDYNNSVSDFLDENDDILKKELEEVNAETSGWIQEKNVILEKIDYSVKNFTYICTYLLGLHTIFFFTISREKILCSMAVLIWVIGILVITGIAFSLFRLIRALAVNIWEIQNLKDKKKKIVKRINRVAKKWRLEEKSNGKYAIPPTPRPQQRGGGVQEPPVPQQQGGGVQEPPVPLQDDPQDDLELGVAHQEGGVAQQPPAPPPPPPNYAQILTSVLVMVYVVKFLEIRSHCLKITRRIGHMSTDLKFVVFICGIIGVASLLYAILLPIMIDSYYCLPLKISNTTAV